MDIVLLLFGILAVILGLLIMRAHKFYKYEINDMLFATKLNVFLSGLLFFLIGLYGIFDKLSILLQ